MSGKRLRAAARHRLPPPRSCRIERLGAQGDGIARQPEGPLYVAGALPGELVAVTPTTRRGDGWAATLDGVLEPAPDRAVPSCRHFDDCGGCSVQHLGSTGYAAFKRRSVYEPLAARGFDRVPLRDPILLPPGTRRRARLAAHREAAGVRLGFQQRHSHRVVDLAACPVLSPVLFAVLAPLRVTLGDCLPVGTRIDLHLSDSDTGLDLVLIGPAHLDLAAREALAQLAEAQDLARISWQPTETAPPEPVVERRRVAVRLGGARVYPPPLAFLQASREGEAAIQAAVSKGLAETGVDGPVLDLFCGCGTLTLALATRHRITAMDADASMLACLETAAQTARLPVTGEQRNLFRDPLQGPELAGYGACVLDPPRAGALAQARALAACGQPPVLLVVSCNPASFARDARVLADGGYRLLWVQPIDQFVWSAHVELVAAFTR